MSELLKFFGGNKMPADVWTAKYKMGDEVTPNDMWKRIITEIANIEVDRGKYLATVDAQTKFEMHSKLSAHGKARFVGLLSGGITHDESFDYFSQYLSLDGINLGGSMMQGIGNHKLYSSLSNCLVLGQPFDSIGGVNNKTDEMSQAFKRRCGVGIDLSTLRPRGAKINNQARISEGAVSFAPGFSQKTLEVSQGARRGALMLSMNMLHPDVLEFIKEKQDLSKLTGANVSVIIPDEFMEAVIADKDILLRFPVDCDTHTIKDIMESPEMFGRCTKDVTVDFSDVWVNDNCLNEGYIEPKYLRRVSAKEYWGELVRCAHNTAEPGIIFSGNWEKGGLDYVYPQYRPVTTNPCVAPETLILTDKGHIPIIELVDTEATIWNGWEWSKVTPRVTGENQEMLKVTFSDGSSVRVTKYHKFPIVGHDNMVEAKDLLHVQLIKEYQIPSDELDDEYLTIKNKQIVSIVPDGICEKVYCFNEPKNHTGIFNGIYLGNCSEIPMPEYDACRLLAKNLYTFVKNPFTQIAHLTERSVMYDFFYEQMIIGDLIIDLETQYIDRIINKISSSKDPQHLKDSEIRLWTNIKRVALSSRRVGTGFTALADMLAALGRNYYSPDVIQEIFSLKMKAELDATIDMAIMFGTFDGYDAALEDKSPYIELIKKEFPDQYHRMSELGYGRRNVSWSTGAPTGSLSILTQTSSGVEPVFAVFYERRKKCMSETDRVDYVDPADGQKFSVYYILHPKFVDWVQQSELVPYMTKDEIESLDKESLLELVKKSPWSNNCAEDLNWMQRIEIQSIVQRYTTHAISSTINLPNDVDVDTVANIYIESWRAGLKGNTVYRDGSRGGVLVTAKENKESTNFGDYITMFDDLRDKLSVDIPEEHLEKTFQELPAQKRPSTLKAHIHTIKCNKKVYVILIGLINEKPYEMFVVSNTNIAYSETHGEGVITKDGDEYNFSSLVGDLANIGNMEDDEKTLSIYVSGLLRHRTPVKKVISYINKTKPIAGTFAHRLTKLLGMYINNSIVYAGDTTEEKCPQCEKGVIVRENGCYICKDCGYTKC